MNLILGDCVDKLKDIPDNSVDSVVTDPPYHLVSIVKRFGKEGSAPAKFGTDGAYSRASRGFMGKTWDGGDIAFNPELWTEVYRVLKPGGHLLSFSATRTYHRMACAIEDAGFEIRDQIMWVYGSGFPKSHDISKAIDRQAGAEREVVGKKSHYHSEGKRAGTGLNHYGLKDGSFSNPDTAAHLTAPATEEAKQWEGWGTALKPAHEPICVARKPLSETTIAENVLKWGTGAINIDGCRVEHITVEGGNLALNPHLREKINGGNGGNIFPTETERRVVIPDQSGRWPANFIHDGSDEVVSLFPQSKGAIGDVRGTEASRTGMKGTNCYGEYGRVAFGARHDSGSAARFFYTAKTSKSERNTGGVTNTHPTVKPKALMAYLCRLVTPPNGTVLDPFMGSGSTGIAAIEAGFDFIGIEREKEYFEISKNRIEHTINKKEDVLPFEDINE